MNSKSPASVLGHKRAPGPGESGTRRLAQGQYIMDSSHFGAAPHKTPELSLGCVLVELSTGKVSKTFLASGDKETWSITALQLYQCCTSQLHSTAPNSSSATSKQKHQPPQTVRVLTELKRTATGVQSFMLTHMNTGQSLEIYSTRPGALSVKSTLNSEEGVWAIQTADRLLVWDLHQSIVPHGSLPRESINLVLPFGTSVQELQVDRRRIVCTAGSVSYVFSTVTPAESAHRFNFSYKYGNPVLMAAHHRMVLMLYAAACCFVSAFFPCALSLIRCPSSTLGFRAARLDCSTRLFARPPSH
jgi:hypothetical protein